MTTHDGKEEEARMVDKLHQGIELTELTLALRLAMMRQQNPACAMADVMREVCLTKERAWQANQV